MNSTRPPLRTQKKTHDTDTSVLRLTLIFHPNSNRIGASVDLCDWCNDARALPVAARHIGRLTPIFSDGAPLAEPHVSRAALILNRRGDTLHIEPGSPGADNRVGAEQSARALLDREQLTEGVPLRLGHGVVLLLRLVARRVEVGLTEVDAQWFPGVSEEVQQLRQMIALVAPSTRPVWLTGETGVGKEVAANAIHAASERHAAPLVAVNMAAIPESLAASELFGTSRGAFTGAVPRQGYFREADGGTLFLDEIGDAPAAVQAQLLRVLQTGEVQVVGGRPVRVDTRVIAATESHLAESGFRAALRQRLAGFTLEIAPLRQRAEDIGVIAALLLRQQPLPEGPVPFSQCEASPQAAAHWARVFFHWLLQPWSGNVRELGNAVHRAALGDPRVAPLQRYRGSAIATGTSGVVDDAEIIDTYARNGFEIAATARALGMSRPSLYRRLETIPECKTAASVTEEELRAAVEIHGSDAQALARALGVSARGLQQRLGE